MNRMGEGTVGDERGIGLVIGAYAALAGVSALSRCARRGRLDTGAHTADRTASCVPASRSTIIEVTPSQRRSSR